MYLCLSTLFKYANDRANSRKHAGASSLTEIPFSTLHRAYEKITSLEAQRKNPRRNKIKQHTPLERRNGGKESLLAVLTAAVCQTGCLSRSQNSRLLCLTSKHPRGSQRGAGFTPGLPIVREVTEHVRSDKGSRSFGSRVI